jgi:hypothetical protein
MILDVPGLKWKEKNDCVKMSITHDNYKDIYNAFEYYKKMYNDYKRYIMQGIIMRNAIGYIPKIQNYTQENVQQDMTHPPEAEDVDQQENTEETEGNSENSETKDEKSEDVSEDPLDPIKLMKVAVSLDQKPWKKPLDKNLIE